MYTRVMCAWQCCAGRVHAPLQVLRVLHGHQGVVEGAAAYTNTQTHRRVFANACGCQTNQSARPHTCGRALFLSSTAVGIQIHDMTNSSSTAITRTPGFAQGTASRAKPPSFGSTGASQCERVRVRVREWEIEKKKEA